MKEKLIKLKYWLHLKKIYFKQIRDINKHKYIFKDLKLTDNQLDEINNLWIKNYGKKINVNWHKMFTAISEKFDKNYMPELYFQTKLLPVLNPAKLKVQFADKVLTQYFFSNIQSNGFKIPKNILYNCNNFFYKNDKIIDRKAAENSLTDVGEVIIKPILETSSGNGIRILNIKNGIDLLSNDSVSSILKTYKKDYIIQEKICQHKSLASFNASSVNTIRIYSYICKGKVYTSPISLRIGRVGTIVDNAHSGGIQIGIMDNGMLREFAYNEFGDKYDKHPDSKILFKNQVIPKINEIKDFIVKYHYRIPHMGFIGWDFAIDSNENFVLIETNIVSPGIRFPQYCNGESLFGENTEEMIKLINRR